jgi:protocatechuate 3,4-dioxygenase beta subunit
MNKVEKLIASAILRREFVAALGLGSAVAFVGCNGSGGSSGDGSSTTTDDTTDTTDTTTTEADGSCTLIPEETQGPYPLDLSANSEYFRSDITEGKTGIPLTLKLRLVNVGLECAPIANARVDIWHCDKDGVYSGYSQPGVDTVGETFCRGIQLSDARGVVAFQTIYPGWYSGRITHIHFQVYLNSGLVATSQVAFPQDITASVYDSDLYDEHGQNTSVTSFASDNVFSDGTQYQMATVTGDINNGFAAELVVGIYA